MSEVNEHGVAGVPTVEQLPSLDARFNKEQWQQLLRKSTELRSSFAHRTNESADFFEKLMQETLSVLKSKFGDQSIVEAWQENMQEKEEPTIRQISSLPTNQVRKWATISFEALAGETSKTLTEDEFDLKLFYGSLEVPAIVFTFSGVPNSLLIPGMIADRNAVLLEIRLKDKPILGVHNERHDVQPHEDNGAVRIDLAHLGNPFSKNIYGGLGIHQHYHLTLNLDRTHNTRLSSSAEHSKEIKELEKTQTEIYLETKEDLATGARWSTKELRKHIQKFRKTVSDLEAHGRRDEVEQILSVLNKKDKVKYDILTFFIRTPDDYKNIVRRVGDKATWQDINTTIIWFIEQLGAKAYKESKEGHRV